MVNRDIVERLLEWKHSKLPQIVDRDISARMGSDIIAIVGPRRVGKTYFILQMIKHLHKDDIEPLFVDFEDIAFKYQDPKDIIEAYHEVFNPRYPLHLFMDEVQNLDDWGSWLRSLHNSHKYHIMVTGSTSKLLISEISTGLRGRYISKLLLPFSFSEYLRMINADDIRNMIEDRGRIKRYLKEYLEYGGYPEVIKITNDFEKKEKLRSIYQTTLYHDIVDRCNVREKDILEFILRYLISNTANTVSVSKLHRIICSNIHTVSKRTVWKYYNYILDSLSIFEVKPYTHSRKKEMMLPKKVYCVDPGLFEIISMKRDDGRLLETIVFLHLVRRKNTQDIEIRYLPMKNGEVDFAIIARNKVTELIQVCYDPSDVETMERESMSLRKAGRDLGCNDLKMITWDWEEDGKDKIRSIPAWKYLLDK